MADPLLDVLKVWTWGALLTGVALSTCSSGCGYASQPDPWCETHRCEWVDMAFGSEDQDHEGLVEAVAERLSLATGAGISYDSYGVPVRFQPRVEDPKTGKRLCGYTEVARELSGELKSIEIFVATEDTEHCMPIADVVTHEAIHALGRTEHARTGLFSEGGSPGAFLEGASLDALCDAIGWCPLRRAETEPYSMP